VTARQWRDEAACRDLSAIADLFFVGTPVGNRLALAICARCPVQAECLDYAVRTGQVHGVWGGKTQQEVRLLIAKARRGTTRAERAGERHHNAGKALCKRGHLFDAANTYYAPDGQRRCRACLRDAYLSWVRRFGRQSRDAHIDQAQGGGQRG